MFFRKKFKVPYLVIQNFDDRRGVMQIWRAAIDCRTLFFEHFKDDLPLRATFFIHPVQS